MSMNVSLGPQFEEYARAKVASGEYNSVSEVMRDGMRALIARDKAVERWLRTEVAASHAEYQANPDDVLSLDEVEANLAAAHTTALAQSR